MKEIQNPPFRNAWNRILTSWYRLKAPSNRLPLNLYLRWPPTLPEAIRNGWEIVSKASEDRRGFITHLQRIIGVAPTEGRELTQDIKPIIVKCRSATQGAPRPHTNITRNYTHRAERILTRKPDDMDKDNWSIEEVRSLTRSAIIDIMTKWD